MMARGVFHNVEDQTDSLLGEGHRHQIVVSGLLPCNAVQPEMAFSCNEPAGWFVNPKGRKTKVAQAIRAGLGIKVDEVFLVHVHRDHQCKIRQVNMYAGGSK
jgi:ribonuclease BN (tRNA processing enzyme)